MPPVRTTQSLLIHRSVSNRKTSLSFAALVPERDSSPLEPLLVQNAGCAPQDIRFQILIRGS